MSIEEEWKRSLLNKWIFIERKNKKHCFFLESMQPKRSWQGSKIPGRTFSGYYALVFEGAVITAKHMKNLPTNLEGWGKCRKANNKSLLRKLEKKKTMLLLSAAASDVDGSHLFDHIFKEIAERRSFIEQEMTNRLFKRV